MQEGAATLKNCPCGWMPPCRYADKAAPVRAAAEGAAKKLIDGLNPASAPLALLVRQEAGWLHTRGRGAAAPADVALIASEPPVTCCHECCCPAAGAD
jgi:hypothetical protein